MMILLILNLTTTTFIIAIIIIIITMSTIITTATTDDSKSLGADRSEALARSQASGERTKPQAQAKLIPTPTAFVHR